MSDTKTPNDYKLVPWASAFPHMILLSPEGFGTHGERMQPYVLVVSGQTESSWDGFVWWVPIDRAYQTPTSMVLVPRTELEMLTMLEEAEESLLDNYQQLVSQATPARFERIRQ